MFIVSYAARPLSITEVITISIIGGVVALAVICLITTCAIRVHAHRSYEGREPLLGEQYQRYSDDHDLRHDKTQSVV